MDCPLFLTRRQVGCLRISPEGRDTRFTVRASAPAGLYRIYAKGENSDIFLGVWEGGAMSRCFSRELTAPAGRFRSAVACPVSSGGDAWEAVRTERFLNWPVAGGLYRRYGKGWQLALPFDEDGPFPLPDLFCLAHVTPVAGRLCAVFWLDKEGFPKYPPDF